MQSYIKNAILNAFKKRVREKRNYAKINKEINKI